MKITENDALYAAQVVYPKAKNAKNMNKGYSHGIFEIETGEYPERVILKTTQNEENKFSLEKEKRVHGIMQEKGIPCPRIIYIDSSKKRVNFKFMIISKMSGIDLKDAWEKFSKKEKENITEQMGEILGKIHQTKYNQIGYLTPKGIEDRNSFSLKKIGKSQKINPFTLEVMTTSLWGAGRLISNKEISNKINLEILEYIIKNKELSESFEEPSLIHGDFDIINIRVKKIKGIWKICGLLDFEYAASHSREYDFIKLHRRGFFSNKDLLASLLKGYKKYQPEIENFGDKVKFLRITRDIGFAGLLFKAGNTKEAKKVLNYILREIIKNQNL